MPMQEIVSLKPAPSRAGCIIRPHNRCILDDSIPLHERILVPSCPLAPHLMIEDIGVASPLYDLCTFLGIKESVYTLPIHLIHWQMPYPIGVPWPVIQYGSPSAASALGNHHNPKSVFKGRKKGYIVVAPGGKTKMWLLSGEELRDTGVEDSGSADSDQVEWYGPIDIPNVGEVATKHRMGPRPLFITPCRAVRLPPNCLSDSSAAEKDQSKGRAIQEEEEWSRVGVLAPRSDPALISQQTQSQCPQDYHPGVTDQVYMAHPLRRLYDASLDRYNVWIGGIPTSSKADVETTALQKKATTMIHMTQDQVEQYILPMCTDILVQAWAPCLGTLWQHIPGTHTTQSQLKDRGVMLMGKLTPPRSSMGYETNTVWVTIEVRHGVGNLRNMSHADMITVQVPPIHIRIPAALNTKRKTSGTSLGSKHGNQANTKRAGGSSADNPPEQSCEVIRFVWAHKVVSNHHNQ